MRFSWNNNSQSGESGRSSRIRIQSMWKKCGEINAKAAAVPGQNIDLLVPNIGKFLVEAETRVKKELDLGYKTLCGYSLQL